MKLITLVVPLLMTAHICAGEVTGGFVSFGLSDTGAATVWTENEISNITARLREKMPEFRDETTRMLLRMAGESLHFSDELKGSHGERVTLEIMGKTVLIDGKDVSGNLGNKVTHGANSPIIDQSPNTIIASGDRISVDTSSVSTKVSLTLTLSLALTASVAMNIYQAVAARSNRRKRSNPK